VLQVASHLQLTIDLEPDTAPITGRVSSGPTVARPFQGWLELAAIIEQLRNDAQPEATLGGDRRAWASRLRVGRADPRTGRGDES
jgi:hypothetical protein